VLYTDCTRYSQVRHGLEHPFGHEVASDCFARAEVAVERFPCADFETEAECFGQHIVPVDVTLVVAEPVVCVGQVLGDCLTLPDGVQLRS
jgi:hypothetical protein